MSGKDRRRPHSVCVSIHGGERLDAVLGKLLKEKFKHGMAHVILRAAGDDAVIARILRGVLTDEHALLQIQEGAADAQRKASRILNDAESAARDQAMAGAIAAEQQRLDEARSMAQDFIGKVEAEVYRQLKALRNLKELVEEKPAAAPAAPAAEPEQPAEAIDPELAAVIGSAVEEIVSAAPAQSAEPAAF